MKLSFKPSAVLLPILFSMASVGAQQVLPTEVSAATFANLPSITVYASRFEEKFKDAWIRTTIVTADEIQKSGASNVSEVLSRVAGLPSKLNLDGSTNAVIDLKGFGDTASNNIVVLLDGVRLSELEQSMARTSMIPIEAIDHIEITNTGNSVLYGDGANGGTINIVTLKNVGNLTVVSGGLASFGGYQSGIYHSQTLENSELGLFARQYASDNYRKNSKGNELSAGANWVKMLDAQTEIGARFFSSRERNKLPGALPSILLNTSPRDTQVPDYNWAANVDAQSLTLFGKKTIQDIEFAMDLNKRSRKNSDAYSYDAYNVFAGYHYDDWRQSYSNSSSHSDTTSVSPRIKINRFILANNVLQLGYDWLETDKTGQAFLTFGCSSPASLSSCNDAANSAGGNTSQIVHRSKGLYLRDTLNFSSTDRVVMGYRSEHYAQSRTADYGYGPNTFSVDGKAYASEFEYAKAFDSNLTAYFRLSRNFRIANADDNSNVAYSPGPVPLRVQHSQDMDWGLNYQTGLLKTEANFFRSNVKNEIGFDPMGCGSPPYAYACNVNFSPTKRQGVNLRQKLALSKKFNLRANLQYVQAKFIEGTYLDKSVPGVAAFAGNLSLDYQLNPRDQITLTTRWAQSRYMSGDFENSQPKVPSYAVGDLSYFIREKNWSVVASIINLTNKQYSDTGIYKSSFTPPYNLTLYPNPGRSLSLSARYIY